MLGSVAIRSLGRDNNLRFLVQRRDGKFWTGRAWTTEVPKARLYARLRDAQHVCTGMQLRRQRGKPKREFTCQLRLTVHGEQPYTLDDLRDYLQRAIQLSFDTFTAGEGPGNSFVAAQALLFTLKEAG